MSGIGISPPTLSATWKYAILGGLISIPFTTASYWQTGSELSLSVVLVGGLIAGFLAKRRVGDSVGVGLRAGLIGALPVLWMLFDMLQIVSGLSNPLWFSAVLVVMSIGIVGIVTGLAALGAELGARVGGWLADHTGRRQSAAGS